MDGKKRRQINEIAESARRALKLESPVDVADVIRRLGGNVERLNDGREAMISRAREGNSFVIHLDESKPSVRRAFSLAHELGHLILHMGFGRESWQNSDDYRESYERSGYSDEEYEANEFAAAFLMPIDEFKTIAAVRDLKSVAEHFGVSTDAALTRGRWLGVYSWT